MEPAIPRLARSLDFSGNANRPRTRRVERHLVNREAMVSSTKGDAIIAALANISTHGCNIQIDAGWLRIGSFISLALADEKPVQGIVRWLRGGSAGIEFLRPLTPDLAVWMDMLSDPDEA